MRNIKYMIGFMFIAIMFMSTSYAAVTVPTTIRVGLESNYKEQDTIKIGSQKISIGEIADGNFIELFNMNSATGFSVYNDYLFYIKINKEFYTYSEAKQYINALSIGSNNKYIAYAGNGIWNVYLGGYISEEEMNTGLNLLRGNYPSLDLTTAVITQKRNYLVSNDTGEKTVFENTNGYVYFTTSEGKISLVAKTYRGYMQFVRVDSGKMTAVNTLPFDQYLYGVVSTEMSPSWPLDALKAQAIAARNYATMAVASKKYKYYDISDTTNDQAYKGYNVEGANSNTAVDETSGQVLMYNGKLVSAFYFSSSGGYTDNSENVWASEVPYLKAVKDTYELPNSNSKWEVTITKAQIKLLLQGIGKNIGEISDITVIRSDVTGRVSDVSIVGTTGTYTLQKELIRTSFKAILGSSLKSRNFYITNSSSTSTASSVNIRSAETTKNKTLNSEVFVYGADGNKKELIKTSKIIIKGANSSKAVEPNATTVASDSFLIHGSGWGHGVGMSQYGAKGMAQYGFKYDEILEYYYTGSSVENAQ